MNNAQLKGMRMMWQDCTEMVRGNGLRDVWTCPHCKEEVNDFPAISRRDNKTEICSDCGTKEALNDYFKSNKEEHEIHS